jgi:FAD/FMN-containing dehydrogenase
MSAGAIVERLRALVGDGAVLTAPEDLAGYRADSAMRAEAGIVCVVRPADTAAVARVVVACRDAGVPVVPRGGGTGYAGGALPLPGQEAVVLSVERLRRIRAVDPVGNVLVAEAGCTLHEVREAAAAAGRAIGLDHGGAGTSQIGGNLATNAGGNNVVRYGMARDQVLGVEAVLADGTILGPPAALPKSNAGYDLRHLILGSEGTLAVITAAALRMRPEAVGRETALLGLASPEQAIALFVLARGALGEAINAFELMARAGLELHFAHTGAAREPFAERQPWYVLLECESTSRHFDLRAGFEALLAQAIEQGVVRAGAIATSAAQRRSLWSLREGIVHAMGAARYHIVKTDTAVPVARVPEFIARVTADCAARVPGCVPVAFGHIGDGNIHLNVLPPAVADDGALRAAAKDMARAIEDIALGLGGTVSAEHGIGQAKRAALARMRPARELELMRAIKRAFDPQGVLNPGKILDAPLSGDDDHA